NAAWTLLGAARGALEQTEMTVGLEQIEAARAELFVAEGSDWFWWYGDDFVTDSAATFDALFRGRVAQAYRALGLPVPTAVSTPIIAPSKDLANAAAVIVQPRRLIQPLIDGYSRNYYEWAGAGQYRPGSAIGGSMFQGASASSKPWSRTAASSRRTGKSEPQWLSAMVPRACRNFAATPWWTAG